MHEACRRRGELVDGLESLRLPKAEVHALHRLMLLQAQPGGDAGMHETLMHLFFPKGGAIKSR